MHNKSVNVTKQAHWFFYRPTFSQLQVNLQLGTMVYFAYCWYQSTYSESGMYQELITSIWIYIENYISWNLLELYFKIKHFWNPIFLELKPFYSTLCLVYKYIVVL